MERTEGQTPSASGRQDHPCGVLLIDKPPGPTSHDVVTWVRWAMRERAVGHCGTLDPAASGLLVVCVGAATKLVRYLQEVDKVYRASFALGVATTTADADGDVVARAEVSVEAMSSAASVLYGMAGELTLAPPAYSAIRHEGRRAHELARSGEPVDLAPRKMTLLRIDEVGTEDRKVAATLTVSKGTYVRSLAEELGRRLQVPAHLGGLRRLACGRLALEHPLTVGGLEARAVSAGREGPVRWRIRPPGAAQDEPTARRLCGSLLGGALLSPADALPFTVLRVEGGPRGEDALTRLGHGQRLDIDHPGLGDTEAIGPLETHVGVSGTRGQLLVARVERAGTDAIGLRPERMVVAAGSPA
jgi:tRNA pseudouridine55 synthase